MAQKQDELSASRSDDDLPDLFADAESSAPAADRHGHVSVLPAEVLQLLQPKPGQVMLDCTLGRGGHAELIAPLLGPQGRYIGLDVDPRNIEYAKNRLANAPVKFDAVHANFAQARDVLDRLGIKGVDLLLADLGFASNQMSDPTRGFSFSKDGPLDMRLNPELPTTAADIVNTWPERELADVIYKYGEERLSRKIARKIAEVRGKTPIKTTAELAQLVRQAYGFRQWSPRGGGKVRIDPATRTFMALRIAVNAELEALEQLLAGLPGLMNEHGIAAIISFHSLEDRLVKHAFVDLAKSGSAKKLTPKPIIAEQAERDRNPRSRSAKLRAIEWIGPRSIGALP